jgi:hypothetical protein
MREPGGAKPVCQWYMKGNCKFGHKCALAHILPGQSMAMDRKNKKAAQIANGGGGGNGGGVAGGGGGGGSGGRDSRDARDGRKARPGGGRNSLLGGSTAPTRAPMRPPGLATAISPSAPAPPVQTTDFHLDEGDKLPTAPAAPADNESALDDTMGVNVELVDDFDIPVAVPRRPSVTNRASDFGPIGSPPRKSPGQNNGFSPATSPSRFLVPLAPQNDHRARAGIASSLGATRMWTSDFGPRDSAMGPTGSSALGGDLALPDDDDIADVVPGSMDDMTNLEEKMRGLGRPAQMPLRPVDDGSQVSHNYSRSMPAHSLLGDVQALWGSDGVGMPASPGAQGVLGGGLGNGTPRSFKSGGFGGRADDNGMSLSPGSHVNSLLSPSNASAAFLPGLHANYRAGPALRPYANQRSISASHAPGQPPLGIPGSLNAGGLLSQTRMTGPPIAMSPPMSTGFVRPGLESLASEPYFNAGHLPPMPLTSTDANFPDHVTGAALSPGTMALQAHAPGQSLPQGLAAGYSRMHAQPLPANLPSPAAFSPGKVSGGVGNLGYDKWVNTTPGVHPVDAGRGAAGSPAKAGGREAMLARYGHGGRPAPIGLAGAGRMPSGGRGWGHMQTPLSPLAGPVAEADDDDVFILDH